MEDVGREQYRWIGAVVVRILAGRWAGKPLASPGGRVRPTAEALRGAWLTWLGEEIAGARVLDLFAGTGALGLEALSRGARTVDFVEDQGAALHALKANIAALRVTKRTRLFKRDAVRFTEGLGPDSYDVTFADPPYGSRQAERVVRRWLEVPFSRLLVVEHAAGEGLPGRGKTRVFGPSALTLYRRSGGGSEARLGSSPGRGRTGSPGDHVGR